MHNILALDYGTKRIGLAVCDPLGIAVKPLPFIYAQPQEEAFRAICSVVLDRQAETVLLGLPINMDGTEGPAVVAVRKFAALLESVLPTGVTILYWDESLTTHEAEGRLLAKGLNHRQRKQVIDSLSAAILLKSWLDEQK
jgi:putative pre-16S rRNA nuclease